MIERAQAQLSRWVYELVLSSYKKYFNLGRNQVDGDDIHAVRCQDPAGAGAEHAEVGHVVNWQWNNSSITILYLYHVHFLMNTAEWLTSPAPPDTLRRCQARRSRWHNPASRPPPAQCPRSPDTSHHGGQTVLQLSVCFYNFAFNLFLPIALFCITFVSCWILILSWVSKFQTMCS